MLVVIKNAEETLIKTFKTCWEEFPTHRCLHLKFSMLEQNKDEWFGVVLEQLRSFLDDKSAQLYITHDNDVFVVTRFMTQKMLEKFLNQLTPRLAPTPHPDTPTAHNLTGLASLFEIGVHYSTLLKICKAKIEHRNAATKTKASNENPLPKVSTEKTVKTVDAELIASLAKRRDKREKPEILVVEDDPFSQKLVSNALKSSYSYSVTGDGKGAILNYVNKAPDVLFLDIGLPDMTGHDVLEKLFAIDPNAYVVMFSGNGDRENIMRAVQLGAKGFVGKPFTQDKLLQYIEKSPFIRAKHQKEKDHADSLC